MRRSKTNNLLFLCFLLCLCAGCRPHYVIPPQQMEDLLVDLHRTDGIISVVSLQCDKDSLQEACYQYVLDKHGFTQERFDSSLVWYTSNPLIFDKVYPRVLERLKAEQQEVQSLLAQDKDKMRTTGKKDKKKKQPTPEQWQPVQDIIDRNLHGLKPLLLRNNKEKVRTDLHK